MNVLRGKLDTIFLFIKLVAIKEVTQKKLGNHEKSHVLMILKCFQSMKDI